MNGTFLSRTIRPNRFAAAPPLRRVRTLAGFVMLLVALLAGSGWAAPAPEVRGIWVSRFEWPSASQATAKANIDQIMQSAKDNNFNTVFFQVRGQCDVHYPSPYEPWSDTYSWANPGWDPLAYAIQAAHSRGLEFHAYINTHTLAQTLPPAVTSPQHMYNLHGPDVPLEQSWLIRDTAGATLTSDNYYWISPGIPEASEWTRRQVMYVVRNYDVDGVHFDRIRTPAPTYSYDPVTVARFGGAGNPDGLGWGDFMRSQITRDLRNIYGEIMLVKPRVKVSAAPFGIVLKDATTHYQGTGTQSYKEWYQDSWGWLRAGAVDYMVPQIYWQVGSAHPFELLLADWQEHRYGRGIVAGSTTGGGTKTADALLAEHEQTRLQGAMGHNIFSYGTMGNYWSAFKTNRYDQPTTVPDMPWKTAPTLGAIVGRVKDPNGNPVLDARVNMTGDPYNYLSAYDGFFAILNVETTHPAMVAALKNGVGAGRANGITVTPGRAVYVEIVLSNSQGRISLDKTLYREGESVRVTLLDSDLQSSGTATVVMNSSTETADEPVTLTEDPPDSGRFSATVPLLEGPPVHGDGNLAVADGDLVAAVYQDADDGTGSPAQAAATAGYDSIAPVILGVQALNVTALGATIAFSTDEPTSCVVRYGGACGALTKRVSADDFVSNRQLNLSGLSPDTDYYFTVEVADPAGHGSGADNAGSCFTFRTTGTVGLPFYDGFESGGVGFPWALTGTGQWRTVASTANTPFAGAYHMVMDSGTDNSYARNEATLTLDMTGWENVTLSFRAKSLGDESHAPASNPFTGGADFDGVAISADGTTWHEVQPLRSPALTSAYTGFSLNLSAAASSRGLTLNSAFRIRFNHYDNYRAPTDGIAVDDVTVTGTLPAGMKLPPANPRFTLNAPAQLGVAWDDTSGGAASFVVDRSVGVPPPAPLAVVGPGVTSFLDTTLSPGASVRYRIGARNLLGEVAYSDEIATVTLPAAPAGLAAAAVSQTLVNLSWTPGAGASGCEIQRAAGAGDFEDVGTVPGNAAAFADTTAPAATDLRYRIRSVNAGGASPWSGEATATTPPFPPAAPRDLAATFVAQTTVTLQWVDASDNEDGFRVQLWNGSGFDAVGTVPANTQSATVGYLDAGTTHTFRVEAYNTGGGSASAPLDVATPPWPPVGAPLGIVKNPAPARQDQFAAALALSHDRMAVGAPHDGTAGPDSGTVYLFDLPSTAPARSLTSPRSARGALFGASVAFAGDLVIVGAPGAAQGRNPGAGAVFVFDAATGALVREILCPAPARGDAFGTAVAADQARVVVGAPYNDSVGRDAGAVFVFDLATGALERKIANPQPGASDRYGWSVAIEGSAVLGGAPYADRGADDAGSAFLTDLATTAPALRLAAPSPRTNNAFGWSVSLSGGRAIVGAPGADRGKRDAGAAFVFDTVSGSLLRALHSPIPGPGDFFGTVVSARAGLVVITAPGDDRGAVDAGRAFVFDAESGILRADLPNPAPARGDMFGQAAACGDHHIAVGAPRDDFGASDAGAAWLYNGMGGDPVEP